MVQYSAHPQPIDTTRAGLQAFFAKLENGEKPTSAQIDELREIGPLTKQESTALSVINTGSLADSYLLINKTSAEGKSAASRPESLHYTPDLYLREFERELYSKSEKEIESAFDTFSPQIGVTIASLGMEQGIRRLIESIVAVYQHKNLGLLTTQATREAKTLAVIQYLEKIIRRIEKGRGTSEQTNVREIYTTEYANKSAQLINNPEHKSFRVAFINSKLLVPNEVISIPEINSISGKLSFQSLRKAVLHFCKLASNKDTSTESQKTYLEAISSLIDANDSLFSLHPIAGEITSYLNSEAKLSDRFKEEASKLITKAYNKLSQIYLNNSDQLLIEYLGLLTADMQAEIEALKTKYQRHKQELAKKIIDIPYLILFEAALEKPPLPAIYDAIKTLLLEPTNLIEERKKLQTKTAVLVRKLGFNGPNLFKKSLLSAPDLLEQEAEYLKHLYIVLSLSGQSADIIERTSASFQDAINTKRQRAQKTVTTVTSQTAQAAIAVSDLPSPLPATDEQRANHQAEPITPTRELDLKKLTDNRPEAGLILQRSAALGGLTETYTEGLMTALLDDVLRSSLTDKETDLIELEPQSPLCPFGITGIRFEYSATAINFSFIFQSELSEAEIDGFKIDENGDITAPDHLFANHPPLRNLFVVEGVRTLLRTVNLEPPAGNLHQVRIHLGLDEYAPEPPTVDERPTENPEDLNTTNLATENLTNFQKLYKALAEAQISESFATIFDGFQKLQRNTQANKTIPPGGVRVEIPQTHPYKEIITNIEIYNVPQTREIIARLNLQTNLFHQNITDSTLVQINYRLADGSISTLNACIIPPANEVYILGSDASNHLAEQDTPYILLQHLILESYHKAVTRTYNPSDRRVPNDHQQPTHPGLAATIRTTILAVTAGEFPVIVASWQPETDTPSKKPSATPANREALLQEIFLALATSPDAPETTLYTHGIFMPAAQFLQARTTFVRDLLPADAWTDTNQRTLDRAHAAIYIPLESAAAVQEVFANIKATTLLQIPDLEAEIGYFSDDIAAGTDPGAAFEAFLRTQNIDNPESENYYLYLKAQTIFTAPSNEIKNFGALFKDVLTRSKKEDETITPTDVLQALLTMSKIDPRDILIATSGAADRRLPYDFSTNQGEVPLSTIFSDDTAPLLIIPGNKARLSQKSNNALRGQNRSQAMTTANQLQSPFHNSKLGPQISLEPRIRALQVWEFTDGSFAYTYLDAVRANRGLQALQSAPSVISAIKKTEAENSTDNHTDFSDISNFSPAELKRLADLEIISLIKQGDKITGIQPLKTIKQKKVVIFTEEQIGYVQFQKAPATFQEYMAYLKANGQPIPSDLPFDPKLAKIQNIFHDLLR